MTTNVTLTTQGATTTLVLTGGAPGQGVPVGGATGHALTKRTGTSYDTEWRDPSVRDSFTLNSGAGVVADVPGKMVWNAIEGTMDLRLNANVTLQVGQEHNKLCRNISGATIPDGKVVCHSCDNPPCVNPNHLFLGNTKDNAMDRERKGRGRSQHSNLFVRKFTDDQIAAMRADKMSGVTTAQLMAKYGISRQYVQRIVNNKRRRITTSQKDGDT